jgi:hypothetical protein
MIYFDSDMSKNDGSGLLPLQNVCIPDIALLVVLLERNNDSTTMELPWELSDPNSGLDILLTHLDTARPIIQGLEGSF